MCDFIFFLFLHKEAYGEEIWIFTSTRFTLWERRAPFYVCVCVCVGSHKADLFLSLKVTIKRRSWSQYWVIFRDKNKTKEKNSLYFVNVCGTFITYLLLLRYKKVTEVYIILHTVFIPHASEPVKCKISD